MIQPLTVVTFVLACSSGLYLYQSKHEVQLLDRTIERAVHETGALREQSRLLAAEWTIQNDPERLRRFSNAYLHLKTIVPGQFTSLADLGNRLPPPGAEATPQSPDEQEVIPIAPENLPSAPETASEPTEASVADEILPVPPMPVPPMQATPPSPVAALPVTASPAHPADVRAAAIRPAAVEAPAHTIVPEARSSDVHFAEARSAESRTSEQRLARNADARADMRTAAAPSSTTPSPTSPGSAAGPFKPIILAAPKSSPAAQSAVKAPRVLQPVPPRPAVVATSEPMTGSLLGMAHTSAPSPIPRPTPVVATYNAN